MLVKLLLLFILVPIIEVALLSALTEATGWWVTMLVIIATGALGAWLARRQGWKVFALLREEMAQGRLPANYLLEAGFILVAGVLLLTPGLLTDALGFSLLIPQVRQACLSRLGRWFRARFRITEYTNVQPPTGAGDVVDSYAVNAGNDDRLEEPR